MAKDFHERDQKSGDAHWLEPIVINGSKIGSEDRSRNLREEELNHREMRIETLTLASARWRAVTIGRNFVGDDCCVNFVHGATCSLSCPTPILIPFLCFFQVMEDLVKNYNADSFYSIVNNLAADEVFFLSEMIMQENRILEGQSWIS